MAQAQADLLRARRRLRRRPTGRLLTFAADRPADSRSTPVRDLAQLERMAVAVRRASDYGLFRPTCLVRALALEEIARRLQVAGALVRVGVRREQGVFGAHAWLEVDGRVVGDTPENVADFVVLDDFSALYD